MMVDDRTFIEVFIDVIHKMREGIPMLTAKEELLEDFIEQWVDIYGDETVI
jgi:hypothetical protein